MPKEVGLSTTLAWPGWNQPDIKVDVDTARLNTSVFKKCCEKFVFQYYYSTEFKSALNVYLHGEVAARVYPVLNRTIHLGVSLLEGGLLAGRE